MICPSCGDSQAYIGLTQVLCPNDECSHFDETQLSLSVGDNDEEEQQPWEDMVTPEDWDAFYADIAQQLDQLFLWDTSPDPVRPRHKLNNELTDDSSSSCTGCNCPMCRRVFPRHLYPY